MNDEVFLKIQQVFKKTIGLSFDKNFLYHGHAFDHNNNWKGTSYVCKEKKIAHFTSLKNLLSILNEKTLRMYSMNHPFDTKEFSEAWKILLNHDGFESIKKDFFYISFSNIKSIDNPVMWRLYGRDGNGVCLIFEIEDDPTYWNCFHYCNVIYNYENLIKLKKNLDAILGDGAKLDLIFPLKRICGFHKSKFFEHEEEIRMISYKYMPFDLKEDINERNEITKYFPLSIIHQDKSKENPYTIPKIRLKKIILGYNVDESLIKEITLVSNILLKYPNPKIQVIKKHF